jgi:hypothetical protein
MRYESIADVFSAKQKIREGLEIVLGGVSPDEASRMPPDGGWSIQQVLEHIAIVDSGAAKICSKLLDAAREDNRPSDGSFSLTDDFIRGSEAAAKSRLDAPDRVMPSGHAPIAQSLQNLTASQSAIETMESDMERLDLSGHTFPHPFFGALTAAEWLVVAGGHELRHTLQIQRVLEQIRR